MAQVLGVAPWHGFNARLEVGPGVHTVCVYALSKGSAAHTSLSCMTG